MPVEQMHLAHMVTIPPETIAQYSSGERLRAAQRILAASMADLGVNDENDHLIVASAYANKWMMLEQ